MLWQTNGQERVINMASFIVTVREYREKVFEVSNVSDEDEAVEAVMIDKEGTLSSSVCLTENSYLDSEVIDIEKH